MVSPNFLLANIEQKHISTHLKTEQLLILETKIECLSFLGTRKCHLDEFWFTRVDLFFTFLFHVLV